MLFAVTVCAVVFCARGLGWGAAAKRDLKETSFKLGDERAAAQGLQERQLREGAADCLGRNDRAEMLWARRNGHMENRKDAPSQPGNNCLGCSTLLPASYVVFSLGWKSLWG